MSVAVSVVTDCPMSKFSLILTLTGVLGMKMGALSFVSSISTTTVAVELSGTVPPSTANI